MAEALGKRDAVATLRRVIARGDWVALDTETTDLGQKAELVEIAIVWPNMHLYQTLVRPQGTISRQATHLHGLDRRELTKAPIFADVAAEIRRHLTRRTVLGYHVDFDRRVLWREFSRATQPAPQCRWLCLCELMTRHTGRRLPLDLALSRMGIKAEQPRHRAAPDAQSVIFLAERLAATTGPGRTAVRPYGGS